MSCFVSLKGYSGFGLLLRPMLVLSGPQSIVPRVELSSDPGSWSVLPVALGPWHHNSTSLLGAPPIQASLQDWRCSECHPEDQVCPTILTLGSRHPGLYTVPSSSLAGRIKTLTTPSCLPHWPSVLGNRTRHTCLSFSLSFYTAQQNYLRNFSIYT